MKSLDLFSGIGGLTLSLRGACEAVAYCDIDPECRKVIEHNMALGRLPRAPIFDDVRSLDAEKLGCLKTEIEVIVAGSPCAGLSSCGAKAGLEHRDSALVSELLRLVSELRPTLVCFENVAGILKRGADEVLGALRAAGYRLKWMLLPAHAVGSPQQRIRFFCVAVRRGENVPAPFLCLEQDAPGSCWGAEPVPRMVTSRSPGHQTRLEQLGNAAIPQQARAAFARLCAAHHSEVEGGGEVEGEEKEQVVHGGPSSSSPSIPFETLVIDPATFVVSAHGARDASQVLTTPATRRFWATPRRSCPRPARVLTTRTWRDLPTQLRFERGTPDALRGGWPNPEWVEWLQGFPAGYTDTPRTSALITYH